MLWGQSVSISGSSLLPCTLTPISSSERMKIQHRDVVLAHLKELGLRLNVRKVCFSSTENHLSGRGVGSDHDTGTYMSPARIESILMSVKRVREGQSLTVIQFQNLLGLMSAASNLIPFGLLYMRPLQWWLKTKAFSPRGNPLCMIKATRLCLHALDVWRKPLVFVSGPDAGSSLLPRNATDGCISHRLEAVMSDHPACGL